MSGAILTEGLTKDFGSGRGIFGLHLQIDGPEVFGYLGPNGAGKSTTIRLLMGMIRPSAGRATVFGLDAHSNAVEVKKLVGYLPGELPQFGGLKGSEVVAFMARLRGRKRVSWERVTNLATRLELDLGRHYREYSRGNKQKLGLVLAFMHEPQLMILDEPTSGLDPLMQQEFYRIVREARAGGATLFLSSHVLSEVEHVCERVAIIRSGQLVRVAALAELHRMRVHRVEVELDAPPPEHAIKLAAGVEDVQVQANHLSCVVRGTMDPLLRALAGRTVLNLTSTEPSLEEVFLAYYREAPKESQAASC